MNNLINDKFQPKSIDEMSIKELINDKKADFGVRKKMLGTKLKAKKMNEDEEWEANATIHHQWLTA